MSNKEKLQTNNDTLDALISRVNAAKDIAASLPEAGGGGSGGGNSETVIGAVAQNGPLGVEGGVYYVDGNGASQYATSVGNISVMKNSLIYVKNGSGGYVVSGEATQITSFPLRGALYQATGDFTVKC